MEQGSTFYFLSPTESLQAAEARDWAALPQDILLDIFLRLGPREVMLGAEFACKPWRSVALRNPSCGAASVWRWRAPPTSSGLAVTAVLSGHEARRRRSRRGTVRSLPRILRRLLSAQSCGKVLRLHFALPYSSLQTIKGTQIILLQISYWKRKPKRLE